MQGLLGDFGREAGDEEGGALAGGVGHGRNASRGDVDSTSGVIYLVSDFDITCKKIALSSRQG